MLTLKRKLMLGSACLILSFCPPSFAGQKPSPETCDAGSAVLVKCYECIKHNKGRYLGKVALVSKYYKEDNTCVNHKEATRACERTFDVDKYEIGFTAHFKLGIESFNFYYNTDCVPR